MSAFCEFTHGFMHGMFDNMFGGFGMFGGFCGFGGFSQCCGFPWQFNTMSLFSVPNWNFGSFFRYPDFTPQPPAFNSFSGTSLFSSGTSFTTSNIDTYSFSSIGSKTSTSLHEVSAKSSETRAKAKHWTKMTDAEMRSVYGNYDFDITKKYNGTAEDLNKFLNKKEGSVLKGKGNVFIEAQKKYGINAMALIAICGIETGYGTTGNAKKGYNVANIEKPKGASYEGRWRKFNNVDECIMELARLLKENYVDNSGKDGIHLTKLYQINSKYCPAVETPKNAAWAKNVQSCINSIKTAVA